jgi:tRNA pseudouridine65 synthase
LLELLYNDDCLVAINKPAGLLVHKTEIDRHETQFALQILRNQIGQRVYPIHRLDKPTSGALLFAKTPELAARLANTWAETKKIYLAVVRGHGPAELTLDHPITPKYDKYAKNTNRVPQSAVTHFRRLATIELGICIDKYPRTRYSLMQCRLATGRKHQIRRHLKHLSHPVIGDAKYGKSKHNNYFAEHLACPRLLLHAHELEFSHPQTQALISLRAPLDDTMATLFTEFGWSITQ